MVKYKQIRRKKIYEEVAEALHEMIRTGVLKPGDKIDSVQQLAENFQVGRSAIREALSALNAMGLVEIKQGEGTFVKHFQPEEVTFPLSTVILMNKEDIGHLLEVRKIIECGAAQSAAKNRQSKDIEALSAALDEMKDAINHEDLGEKADFHFHLTVAAATHNPLLLRLMDQISEIMMETQKETRRVWLYSKETTNEKLYEEHLKIFHAIVEQDEEKARLAMLEHLENVEEILDKYFKETYTK